MNDLHRFVRRLAESVASRDPAGLRAPLPLAEVSGRIMPYRACRRALDLESVEEYELLLLRLVAEEQRLAQVWPPGAAERCRVELAGLNPDLALLRQLEDVTLQLNLGALAAAPTPELPQPASNGADVASAAVQADFRPVTVLDQPPVHGEPLEPELVDHLELEDEPEPAPWTEALTPSAPPAVPPREAPMTAETPDAPVVCPHCAAALPRDREVRFCPDCGGNVRTRRCAACRTELELSWRHCVMCGQAVGDASRFA